jgi:citrate synthase
MPTTETRSEDQKPAAAAAGTAAQNAAGQKGPTSPQGLEGVVVAQTSLSTIDGTAGKLTYCGYDIHDLAKHSTFEETAFLLWNGRLPRRSELEELRRSFAAERRLPPTALSLLQASPARANPMAVLRTIVSALALEDPESEDNSEPSLRRKAVRLTAQMGTIVAGFHRLRTGNPVLEPRDDLDHAANFLYLLAGQPPSPEEGRILDVCLVLHADHGFNASTFASRVTIATLSDMYSAICSALGTLKGPLHGGANEAVMQMLLEIDRTGGKAEEAVRERLARKEKISGFGHRVYKTEDPRATHLREFSRSLSGRKGDGKWYEMSQRIEGLMKEEKGLYSNVDFYSATTYYQLGIPIDLFTPVFALSRVSGWTAHVIEQLRNNRLIRPRSEYIGARDLRYVPINER